MGRVYEARDNESGERLALKMLPDLDADRLYKFKREFRALDDIEHPNLISLRELYSDGDDWFFTMEYLVGRDFVSYVRSDEDSVPTAEPNQAESRADDSGFDEGRLLRALRQMVDVLDALHETGRVHRDIKPGNVLVTDDEERLVLLDFGLVAEFESRHVPSTLVERFVDGLRDRESDLVMLFGRCYESESVPFKAFDGIVDSLSHFLKALDPDEASKILPDDLSDLARIFPVLLRVPSIKERVQASADGVEQNPQKIRLSAFETLRTLLSRLGEAFALVLHIDDLHWADADSLLLFRDILESPRSPKLLLLATVRTVEESSGAAPLEQLRSERVRWLELSGLTDDEVRGLLDRGDIEAQSPAWLEQTDGHPLLLQEMLKYHARQGDGPETPKSVEQLIWRRVEALGDTPRQLVEVCSLVGVPLPLSVLRVVLDADVESAHRAAQLGRSVHLLRLTPRGDATTVEPYHDRVREAVSAQLADDTSTQYRERLIDVLRQTGFDEREPMTYVRCLVDVGRDAEAAEEALNAARVSGEALAFEQAADLYQLARRLGDFDRREDRRIGRLLADNLINAGMGAEAADHLLEVAKSASATESADLRRRAAEALAAQGRIDRATQVLESLLGEVGESLPGSRLRLILGIVWHRFWLWVGGLRWKARDMSELPSEDVRRLELFGVVRRMAISDVLLFFYFQTRELRLALELGAEPNIAVGLALEGSNRAAAGTQRGQERARELQSRALELAEDIGEHWHLHFVQTTSGLVDFACARFARAARILGEQIDWFESRPVTEQYILNTYRSLRMNALFFLGDVNQSRRLYEKYMRDATYRGDEFMQVALRWWCNYLFLIDGRPARARSVVDEVDALVSSDQLPLQPGNKAVALVHIALYEGTVAEEFDDLLGPLNSFLETQQARSFGIIRTMVRWLKGRLVLARQPFGTLDRYDRKLLSGVMSELESEYLGPAQVYVTSLKAGIALQDGDRSRAIREIRHTIRVAEDHDLALITACHRFRLSELLDGELAAKTRQRAMDYMEEQGVVEPRKVVRAYAFGRPGH